MLFVRNLLYDYSMLFGKHNLIEVRRQLWSKQYCSQLTAEETKVQRSSHEQWMTEIGPNWDPADSRALIISLIAPTETQPPTWVKNAAEFSLPPPRTVCSRICLKGLSSPECLHLFYLHHVKPWNSSRAWPTPAAQHSGGGYSWMTSACTWVAG